MLSALVVNKPRDAGVRAGQEGAGTDGSVLAGAHTNAARCAGAQNTVSRGGGRDRVASGHVRGRAHPGCPGRCWGRLGRSSVVPLSCSKQVRAVASRWNSSSSLGGPGSAQGGEDNQDQGRVSQKDPPRTCPAVQSSGSNPVLPLQGAWVLLWKAGATAAKGPQGPRPFPAPLPSPPPAHAPHLPDPWGPQGRQPP